MEKTPSMIFITGGVRSGKSSFAEKMATERAIASNGTLNYIATGLRSDLEMERRIEKHRQDRQQSDQIGKTWEQPRNIGKLAENFTSRDILLLDCLTTLLNNELFDVDAVPDNMLIDSIIDGIGQLKENCHSLIIVSNEILNEPIQNNELVLTYKKTLGILHQHIVSNANQAFLVESGVPILMKEVT
ncbi:bifunctional adenosylcobinamide kinase/adenosylcobinamide-phosphate guanylyltransferase [Pseudalkalibacillus sp. A8]|uniref:bifunctional adenosylcobinamide kinase/adenosylcobinamide-phosphate guanylyltransferase n=1 Tax=Pseudalkalibacillus sp. A8 TaxID=3382641 RepID=UPI0038B4F70B